MLKNRKATALAVLAIFIVFCFVLSSCDLIGQIAHTHKIEWTEVTPATETTEGLKRGVCSVCGKTFDEAIPVISHKHVLDGEWLSNVNSHWQICSSCNDKVNEDKHSEQWVVDTPATVGAAGSKHSECPVCHMTFDTVVIPALSARERTVDLYAINDFHGATDVISQVGGYLKGRVNSNPNTVLINSGDMFQGSMESNSNYGSLLSRCMSQIGFDAFTFGNHEFDWGLENLQTLSSNSAVPFLGANIYHWDADSKTWGTFADELAQEYTIKTLDNGLKIGIIGVIGQNQITSISSNLVQTIGFKDPLPIIKELATELRNNQGCDVVVVSAHTGPQSLVGEEENNQASSSAAGLEQYVDAVFCAHTHREQVYVVDGLPFIQGGSYGNYVSHVQLQVESNGHVGCTEYENVPRRGYWDNLIIVDEMVDNSNEQIKDERNQVLATFDGGLERNPDIARLVSRAIAEYAVSQGHSDIALAMVNTARNDLPAGQITYSQLYEAIPFDNVVYIARVKGSEILGEIGYGNYFWRVSGTKIENNKYYKIAVIDYLLFHQNATRDYNYFPSAFRSDNDFAPVALTRNGDVYNYRQITRDYLLANKNVKSSDYNGSNTNIDVDKIEQNVSLKYSTSGKWQFGAVSAKMQATLPQFGKYRNVECQLLY